MARPTFRLPVPQTGSKTKRTSTTTVTSSFTTTGQVWSTDKARLAMQAVNFVWMTDKWRQRPVWCSDGENSSGLYIAFSSMYTCPSCQLLTERVCRLLLPLPTLTKEPALTGRCELWTTKAMDRRHLPGLGKASMPKTPHPR
eukprot:4224991-Amphidinium_carterae.1